MQMSPGDIRSGKLWYAVHTRHYMVMFDQKARKVESPERFAARAERRLPTIADLLDFPRPSAKEYYPIGGPILYFVHDRKVLGYGNVEFHGIDVPVAADRSLCQHEEAHAFLHRAAGEPPSFFNEGFACFASHPRSDVDHRCCLIGIQHGVTPSVSTICDWDGFWGHWKVYKPFLYRMAGSFVAWSFQEYGSKPFREFAASCAFEAGRQKVHKAFRSAYKCGLREAESKWRDWLAERQGQLCGSPRRRIGHMSQAEWERTRVQMVLDALGKTQK